MDPKAGKPDVDCYPADSPNYVSPQILSEAQGLFCQDPQNRKVKRSDAEGSPFTYGNLSNTIEIWVDNAEDVDISEDACNEMMDVIGDCDGVRISVLTSTWDVLLVFLNLTFSTERFLQAWGGSPIAGHQLHYHAYGRPHQPATVGIW